MCDNFHLKLLYDIIVDCDVPPTIENGDVIFNTTTINSTATYTCKDGYTLTEDATSTCESDGKWSGQEDRKCEGIDTKISKKKLKVGQRVLTILAMKWSKQEIIFYSHC